MASSPKPTPVPNINQPFVNDAGAVSPAWHGFFQNVSAGNTPVNGIILYPVSVGSHYPTNFKVVTPSAPPAGFVWLQRVS